MLGLAEMNLFPSRPLLAAACCLGLAACATHRNRNIEAPIKAPPVVVGKVAAVNQGLGFVLVQTAASLDTGVKLETRDKNGLETASLCVSTEKKPPFVIANITKGKPTPGDMVTKQPW